MQNIWAVFWQMFVFVLHVIKALRTYVVKLTGGGSGNVQSYSAYGSPLGGGSQSASAADFSQSGTATGADLFSKAFTGIQQFAGYGISCSVPFLSEFESCFCVRIYMMSS